jgi:aspartyl-tRNA(Asn)/glutamyl-tRNA(Gln) amidotransferase subunit A
MDRAVAALRESGMTVEEISLPQTEQVGEVFGELMVAELMAELSGVDVTEMMQTLDPVLRDRIAAAGKAGTDLESARARVAQLARSARARTRGFTALLGPTVPFVARREDSLADVDSASAWNRAVGRNTRPGNVFGNCGISLPIHRDNELPVGLQLLGAAGDDVGLLSAALVVEAVIGRAPRAELSDSRIVEPHDRSNQ